MLEIRDRVFRLCHGFYDQYIGDDKARAARIPVPIIYELKSFFQSVLPELIDNVRLHKRDQPINLCALYIRLRRRDEQLYGARRHAEPSSKHLTPLKRQTLALWQNDIVEAVFFDTGMTIQESWQASWKAKASPQSLVPKLPSGKRVDGHNADSIILEGVFTENASSLSPEERLLQHLPLRLTGLHSLRQTIHGSLWSFSVRSGENSVIVLSGSEDQDMLPLVKREGR